MEKEETCVVHVLYMASSIATVGIVACNTSENVQV